ncbi:MAG: hypothetical protein K2I72_02720 [Bacilli bacterium]|nr:hypothetical protein [Bacilli bacterium]
MKKNNDNLMKEVFSKCFGKEKEERWNAVAMLLIFGIFLAVIIVIARTTSNVEMTKPEETVPTPSPTVTPELEKQDPDIDLELPDQNYEVNYSYLFTFTLDGIQEIITGKRLDSKEIFSIINSEGTTEYARLSENYLKKENGTYHLTSISSSNLVYADLDPLLEILEDLTPNIERNQYVYSVPTSELLKSYHNNTTLVDPNNTYNTVVVQRGENSIERIDLDYSNLYSLINGVLGQYTIAMEFNHVGTTEDFTIRID